MTPQPWTVVIADVDDLFRRGLSHAIDIHPRFRLVGEAAVYRLVSRQVRDVRAVYFSHGGCGFYHAIVQLKKSMEGTAKNAITVGASEGARPDNFLCDTGLTYNSH